ncbi:hypothetical protein PQX77_002447 [Marasmius sp. AFHP31]|nr:hypothetical protein PQX77_002447 [Marasmius sp. AFHP31]
MAQWRSLHLSHISFVVFNGLPLRPNDPRCSRVGGVSSEEKDDDSRAEVGGQRGVGMHTRWAKDQKAKPKTPIASTPTPTLDQQEQSDLESSTPNTSCYHWTVVRLTITGFQERRAREARRTPFIFHPFITLTRYPVHSDAIFEEPASPTKALGEGFDGLTLGATHNLNRTPAYLSGNAGVTIPAVLRQTLPACLAFFTTSLSPLMRRFCHPYIFDNTIHSFDM